jgi:hypothetical protein
LKLLLPLAQDGNVRAQRMLGYMYSNGQGVERDEVAASRWYCLSVRSGFEISPGCPWFVYLTRAEPDLVWNTLEITDSERMLGYLRRAEAGDVEAQIAVGLFHASGLGTERDLVQAARWLGIAAEQRHPNAGRLLERLEREMTLEQVREARRLVAQWQGRQSGQQAD